MFNFKIMIPLIIYVLGEPGQVGPMGIEGRKGPTGLPGPVRIGAILSKLVSYKMLSFITY